MLLLRLRCAWNSLAKDLTMHLHLAIKTKKTSIFNSLQARLSSWRHRQEALQGAGPKQCSSMPPRRSKICPCQPLLEDLTLCPSKQVWLSLAWALCWSGSSGGRKTWNDQEAKKKRSSFPLKQLLRSCWKGRKRNYCEGQYRDPRLNAPQPHLWVKKATITWRRKSHTTTYSTHKGCAC